MKEQQALQQSAQLVRDVEAALKADARTASMGIAVTSLDAQVVVLQGLVATSESRAAAQNIAVKVKGVKRVDNRLLTPADQR
jgi:osmotically-inducible protein OsmY